LFWQIACVGSLQEFPAQQTSIVVPLGVAPHAVHAPLEQTVFVAAHAAAGATQVVTLQHPPFLHCGAVAQHVPPVTPHGGTHTPFVHVPPLERQMPPFWTHDVPSQQPPDAQGAPPPVQHTWPVPPQFWHEPPMQVPPPVHGSPLARHKPVESQQPLPRHLFAPAQQALPCVPQSWHTAIAQTSVDIEHCDWSP
jgi:hypothetical protein